MQVSKNYDVLGVNGSVGDPVLLGQGGGSVDDQLIGILVVGQVWSLTQFYSVLDFHNHG